MKASKARKLRALIEALADFLADAEALEGMELFPAWDSAAQYTAGRRVRFQGILYRCLQGHQAQTGWNPVSAPSLWARVLIEAADAVPDWVQPDSTNGYMAGDKVRHLEKVWVSLLDNNCWEPGVYGWEVAA